MFCKKSLLHKIYKDILVLEYLFNIAKCLQSVRLTILSERDFCTGVSEPDVCCCSTKIIEIHRKNICVQVSFKINFRSSCSQMFFKISVLKNFVNFTERTFVRVFFSKAADYQSCNFIKKRPRFPVKLAMFLRTPSFREHLQWRHLTVSGFQPAKLLKSRLRQRCFFVNFATFLTISFDRTPPDDCFWCLSVIF